MDDHPREIACPSCGAAAWLGYTTWTRGPGGDEVSCALCGLAIRSGVIRGPGFPPEPDEVEEEAGAATRAGHVPEGPAYLRPDERRIRLAVLDLDDVPELPGIGNEHDVISSVTIRFRRPRS